jgi:hypothetical protein
VTTNKLHDALDELEAQGVNFQRIMVAHALVESGHVTAIECAMPRCIYDSRSFEPKVRALGLSIDHVIPQSQGGTHHPDNLRLAHLGCNSGASSYDTSRRAVLAQSAKRTRRAAQYARRNAEVRSQPLPVRDDRWLASWAERNKVWQWLASTRDLQMRVYHFNVDGMIGDELADYIMWNVTALTAELYEFLQEVQWKDWAIDRGRVSRDAAIGELVDVGHFLGNLLIVLGVSDDEWMTKYREKQERNAQRQLQSEGYSGMKCPSCHRELDAPGSVVTRNGEGIGHRTLKYCARCDAQLDVIA